uniref:Uncharacterized protein n=1 Tax=Panagrolaimus sp. PS1159 TaxID=55785 RepID=A0AC35FUA9_9BILA
MKQSHLQMSERTKSLNKQLHLTLIIQAIGPLLSGNLPVLILVSMSLFTLENHYISLGCCSLLVWTAIINPIAAMIIITPFRKRIKIMLRIDKSESISTAATSNLETDFNRTISTSKVVDFKIPTVRNNTLEPINLF